MKTLTIIALAVVALGFGACAKKDTSMTTTSSATTGYSK